jgi:hypothetical protein
MCKIAATQPITIGFALVLGGTKLIKVALAGLLAACDNALGNALNGWVQRWVGWLWGWKRHAEYSNALSMAAADMF